ncbi:putative membrane protein [Phytophthora megakarya]|uniref:GDT1 family protein n=1 Tax=Phytophthora megakarya TaxID=4795 RepID=A0A225WCR9_9STRA|nr:putative membrane protein [Phytophthora megakarya]
MARLFLLGAALLFLVAAQPVDPQHGAQADAATPAPVSNSAVRFSAFERADADHNGVVDSREFAAYIDSLKGALGPFLGAFPADGAATWATGARPRLRTGGPHKFWSGFVSGILTIWATEIGDKTFFIAAILSMKKDRVVVFAGAIGALIVMTVLSVVMGVVATKFLPPSLTHYLGGVLFVVFGVKMLYDAREMNAAGPSDELTEVEEELMGKKDEDTIQAENVEEGHAKAENTTDGMIKVFSQTFLMTFLAEWGDRSQIATVTLSATKDVFGVTLGAILGHSMCTGIAVVGGKFLATRISERTVTLVGGVLFVLFALHSFITGPGVSD